MGTAVRQTRFSPLEGEMSLEGTQGDTLPVGEHRCHRLTSQVVTRAPVSESLESFRRIP